MKKKKEKKVTRLHTAAGELNVLHTAQYYLVPLQILYFGKSSQSYKVISVTRGMGSERRDVDRRIETYRAPVPLVGTSGIVDVTAAADPLAIATGSIAIVIHQFEGLRREAAKVADFAPLLSFVLL